MRERRANDSTIGALPPQQAQNGPTAAGSTAMVSSAKRLSCVCRQRSFGDGRWGMTVRDRSDDWLIVWEHGRDREDLVHVRYPGADPFA